MSIVKIKFHDENIYKADSQDERYVLPKKPPMYRSKFEKSIKDREREMKTAKHLQHRTFGFAEIPLPSPDKFLRKDEGIRQNYIRPKTSHPRCTLRRPPIPHLDELKKAQSMQNLDEEKNFMRININRAKSAVLRSKPGPRCFEQTPPVYIRTEKYGNVPRYLHRITDQLRRMELAEKKRQEELAGKQDENVRVVTRDEKLELLKGLQKNWDAMQEEYKRMPLLIDTVPKMIRKTKLENNLKSLERDICLLNSSANKIYIVQDTN